MMMMMMLIIIIIIIMNHESQMNEKNGKLLSNHKRTEGNFLI